MGERAWISIRYKGVYYTLNSFVAPLQQFGEWLVQLLDKFPDPQYWIWLVENATVISVKKPELEENQPPSADFLEALRKFILNDELSKWSWVSNVGQLVVNGDMAFMHHAGSFRSLLRMDGAVNGHWNLIANQASRFPTVYHFCLDHGVLLVSTQGSVPRADVPMEYIYTIDLDQSALFINSIHTVQPGLHFKLGSIPTNWLYILLVPRDWVSACYAYTPPVKKLLLERLDQDDVLFVIFDKLSAPFRSVQDCFQFLEQVQKFFFGKSNTSPKLKEVPDSLRMLVEVYSIPSPKYGPPIPFDNDDVE